MLGDAAAGARASDFRQIYVMFAGQLADERGGADIGFFFLAGGRSRHGRRRWSGHLFLCGSSRSRRWGSSLRRSGSSRGCAIAFADHAHDSVHLNCIAFGDFDLLKNAAGRCGNFGIDLIGGNLKEWFVALDLVARLFEPFCNGSLENRLPHLGHDYFSRHSSLSIKPRSRGGSKQTL